MNIDSINGKDSHFNTMISDSLRTMQEQLKDPFMKVRLKTYIYEKKILFEHFSKKF